MNINPFILIRSFSLDHRVLVCICDQFVIALAHRSCMCLYIYVCVFLLRLAVMSQRAHMCVCVYVR